MRRDPTVLLCRARWKMSPSLSRIKRHRPLCGLIPLDHAIFLLASLQNTCRLICKESSLNGLLKTMPTVHRSHSVKQDRSVRTAASKTTLTTCPPRFNRRRRRGNAAAAAQASRVLLLVDRVGVLQGYGHTTSPEVVRLILHM